MPHSAQSVLQFAAQAENLLSQLKNSTQVQQVLSILHQDPRLVSLFDRLSKSPQLLQAMTILAPTLLHHTGVSSFQNSAAINGVSLNKQANRQKNNTSKNSSTGLAGLL